MYSSEVYGQKHRQAGMSLAVATNFALCGVVAIASLTAPAATLENKWQPAIIFFVVTDAFAIVFVWLFMRTEGLRASSLEDMHVSDIRRQLAARPHKMLTSSLGRNCSLSLCVSGCDTKGGRSFRRPLPVARPKGHFGSGAETKPLWRT